MNGDKDETKLDFTVEELKKIPKLNQLSYLGLVTHLAEGIEKSTGIFYLVPIIQSGHESRWGESGLARNHCNLFGIVATERWKADGRPIAYLPTWEVIKGKRVDMSREFRAYKSWKESFEDWAHIITALKIYKKAYELMKSKNTVLQGIEEMGKVYATDPAYAKKLSELYSYIIKL